MARKAQCFIATSMVVIFFFVAVAVVESGRDTGELGLNLNLRHHLDLPPAAQLSSDAPLLSATSRAASSDEPNIIYEDGFVIETVLDENRLGISIYSTLAVPFEDFLYAVDSTASQLLKIRLPLDQSGGSVVARRVAGDGNGQTGYSDGWGEDALLDHPKGLAIDTDGNVYVADIRNRVIRKISPGGFVTTIAGQPNKTGHADGDGKDALLSSDFTLAYLPRSCSLLISDRGNGRLRLIQLKKPPLKCDQGAIGSEHTWKNVTFVFGVLVTILSAILGLVLYQKAELQQNLAGYLAQDLEGGLPFIQDPNGRANSLPFHSRPRLSDRVLRNDRRAISLPSDVSSSYLIDLDYDAVGDVANNDSESNFPPSKADGTSDDGTSDNGTSDLERLRSTPSELDLGSDSESRSAGLNDNSSADNLPNDSPLEASDSITSLDAALNRCRLNL